MIRLRIYYLAVCLFTALLGLSSRVCPYLPSFFAEYAGDTLWAMMVYWGIGVLFPASRLLKKVSGALLFSYCIEISQLYQADWINAVRGTTLGGLVLGFGFLWSDLICYTLGVVLAAWVDFLVFSKKRNFLFSYDKPKY